MTTETRVGMDSDAVELEEAIAAIKREGCLAAAMLSIADRKCKEISRSSMSYRLHCQQEMGRFVLY